MKIVILKTAKLLCRYPVSGEGSFTFTVGFSGQCSALSTTFYQMGLNPINIQFNSKRVCSALRNYRATGHIDEDILRESYGLLSTCRYISDPMSYATDYPAIEDSKVLVALYGSSIHDMQVKLLNVRIIVDNVLMGTKGVGVTPAVDFFTRMGEIPVPASEAPQMAAQPSMSAV